ncbi:MAG: hypothetical protein AAF939_21450, partial [Planctomycetota bacterium]
MNSDQTNPQQSTTQNDSGWFNASFRPLRIATLRGMAVILPPLLTILLFVWAWTTLDKAVLRPIESLAQTCLAWSIQDIREDA